jgi:UPF0716 protein FxsA
VAALLVLAFLLVPVLEIYVIIQVGQAIGALPTVALLVIESLIGAWIVKREGRTAWRALTEAMSAGRLPGRELADAGLLLVGGTLLLTPGFVTDVIGFFFVLPPTRPLARLMLTWFVARRAARAVNRRVTFTTVNWGPGGPSGLWGPGRGDADDRVVRGETVGDDPPEQEGPGRATGG